MTLFVTIAWKSIGKTRSLSAVEMTLFVTIAWKSIGKNTVIERSRNDLVRLQLPGKVLEKHGH
jgi:hypothetical protein